MHELPPLRLHVDITTPNGNHYRWGDDEPEPENIPSGLRFSSTMPGGFEMMDCILPRKPGIDYADLERLSTIRVVGPGGAIVGEYRLERAPKTSGDYLVISPSAVGWQAHLDDDKSVRLLIIDRDLNRWQGMSRQRKVNVITNRQPLIDPSVISDVSTDVPALQLDGSGTIGGSAGMLGEAWYDAGAGNLIGAVQFEADGNGTGGSSTWLADVLGANNDVASGFITVAADNDAADRALALHNFKMWMAARAQLDRKAPTRITQAQR